MMWYIPDFPNLNHQQYYQDQYETKNNGGVYFQSGNILKFVYVWGRQNLGSQWESYQKNTITVFRQG